MRITVSVPVKKGEDIGTNILSDLGVMIDDELILVCDDPTYNAGNTYVWTKDGIPIFTNAGEVSPTGKYNERIVGTSFQLVINRIDASDEGTYIASHNCESASLNLEVTPHESTVTAKLTDERLTVFFYKRYISLNRDGDSKDSVKVTCDDKTVKGSVISMKDPKYRGGTWCSEQPFHTLPRSMKVTLKERYLMKADSPHFHLTGYFMESAEYTLGQNERMTQIGNGEVKLLKTASLASPVIIAAVGTDVNIPWNYPDSDHNVRVTWKYIDANGVATVILLQDARLDAVVQNGFNIQHNTNGDVTIRKATVANTGTYRITVTYRSEPPTWTHDVKVYVIDSIKEVTCCAESKIVLKKVPVLQSFGAITEVANFSQIIVLRGIDKLSKIDKNKVKESATRIVETFTATVAANILTGHEDTERRGSSGNGNGNKNGNGNGNRNGNGDDNKIGGSFGDAGLKDKTGGRSLSLTSCCDFLIALGFQSTKKVEEDPQDKKSQEGEGSQDEKKEEGEEGKDDKSENEKTGTHFPDNGDEHEIDLLLDYVAGFI